MSQKSGNSSSTSSSSSNSLANDHHYSSEDSVRQKYKYISVAQELVMAARGKLDERNWKTSENGQDLSPATIDDISVFCIPILPFKIEYSEWKTHAKPTCTTSSQSHATTAILNGKSSNQDLEEIGKTVAEADLDDPDDDMDVDPAEEVTVSDVSLTIKEDDEDDDDDDDEGQK